MANKNRKWTQELRTMMYSRLACEFGPYNVWGKVAYPEGRKDRFEEVLRELAAYFTNLTGRNFEWTALWQQMKWGTTKQGTVKNGGFAYLYILNKAAALETEFLSSAALTGFIHTTSEAPELSAAEVSEDLEPED